MNKDWMFFYSGAQFEGDLGEILALGPEISPYIAYCYIGLRKKWGLPKKKKKKKNFFFFFLLLIRFLLVSARQTSFDVSLFQLHLISFLFNVNFMCFKLFC